ncbi:hypothetical protein Cylst_4957 [Cylindrospermum stagnale PCC 7417]|uniref:Uncharacterized protein n=1 Tax=Cylindrospermum stagnale PCC 7417 TaxID=56107 RepID=K9X3F5_9NOST|nr:hypothetical protein [Cylindrospermum stagnale]AFZ27008.1 hypothetical protein Cylst_4957 [Cylindrospermum stagnale PCC 7417]
MKLLKTVVFVGVASVIATSIGIETKPALAECNPFGCSQSSVAECNPFGCPKAPMGAACTPFGCPQSPQQQQPQQVQPYYPPQQVQPYYPPQQVQPYYPPQQVQPYYPPQQVQQQPGTQVPVNQGYNLVGGVWFGPDGKPVSSDRRPGEDQASCIARVSYLTLQAYSRSETHGNYRYQRPAGATPEQMAAVGLENKGGVFNGEQWRGLQPQVTLRVMDSQEATIRCR